MQKSLRTIALDGPMDPWESTSTTLRTTSISQGWSNVLTRGPNSRQPGQWRAGYSAICVIYAKLGYDAL